MPQTTTGDAAVLGKMYGRDGTFNKLYNEQMAYVAMGRGLMPVLDVATFIGSENAPGTTDPLLFAPSALNVDQWVTAAQAMKAKYVVPIAVHSPGLCYWPTATTAYNITATSIPTVDLVGQICTKFRAAGIAVVPYWSIWQGNRLLSLADPGAIPHVSRKPDHRVVRAVRPVPGFWCDGGLWHFGSYYPWTNAADMKNFIHSIQPSCVVINNTHAGNLEDSDLVEYEGGGVPLGNTLPAEGVKSILNDGNWFWKPAAQPQPLRLASSLSPVSANSRTGAWLVASANDTTGNIPSDQLTILTSIGAF
jgi:alpha-L-fucosidase